MAQRGSIAGSDPANPRVATVSQRSLAEPIRFSSRVTQCTLRSASAPYQHQPHFPRYPSINTSLSLLLLPQHEPVLLALLDSRALLSSLEYSHTYFFSLGHGDAESQLSRYEYRSPHWCWSHVLAAYKLELSRLISFGRTFFSVGVGVGAFSVH